jgi:hypothetical protein
MSWLVFGSEYTCQFRRIKRTVIKADVYGVQTPKRRRTNNKLRIPSSEINT